MKQAFCTGCGAQDSYLTGHGPDSWTFTSAGRHCPACSQAYAVQSLPFHPSFIVYTTRDGGLLELSKFVEPGTATGVRRCDFGLAAHVLRALGIKAEDVVSIDTPSWRKGAIANQELVIVSRRTAQVAG